MINDWRKRWADDFSFYYVQLANFKNISTEPGNNDPWPLQQDRMRLVLETTPKTGMAIINDVGDAKDIHPKNKHDVDEDTVIVSSGNVESPMAVRYAWAANSIDANLINSEGLPASVFRTDGWDDVIVKVDLAAVKALSERRALSVEIKALAAKKKDLDRKSDEFKTITAKKAVLMKKYKATAPGPVK